MTTTRLKHTAPINKFARKLIKNRDGVAAIEFALIAPIMIALYLGLAEISLLVIADRNVSHATSVTGDLITQVETIDENEIENVLNATLAVMEISYADASRLSIDILSLEVDVDGDIQEVGYASLGSAFTTKFNAAGVGGTLLNQTSGLVVTRIRYLYQSPSKQFVGTPTLSETFMLKPRKSSTIPFDDGDGDPTIITCTLTGSGYDPRASC